MSRIIERGIALSRFIEYNVGSRGTNVNGLRMRRNIVHDLYVRRTMEYNLRMRRTVKT